MNFDGVNILAKRSLEHLGSGLTVKKGIKSLTYTLPILAHEYGHYLFGYNHGNTGGIMSGNYALSAVERERLGHIAYTNCTQNNFTLTLEDFIMNGDVLRIPIPITNPNSTTFFVVENHQKLSKYDQIIRGGSISGGYDYTDTGSGIYVWLVKNGNSRIPYVYYEAVTADGRWDWTYDGDYYAGPGWYVGKSWEGYLPKTKRTAVNRNTGKTDKKKEHIYWNNHWASKWVDDQPSGSYQLTRDVMGDEYDAFNFEYNELLTPWSNPSSYVDGNTNISIQLYNQNGSNITVKVFTTEASAEALPPSKPQNLQLAKDGNDHPVLTWDANLEPDLNGYRVYRKITLSGGSSNTSYVFTTSTSYTDTDFEIDTKFGSDQAEYWIVAVDNDSDLSTESEHKSTSGDSYIQWKLAEDNIDDGIINNYALYQNYPNPFNPTTQISYQIKESGLVQLIIYNTLGQKVATLVNEVKSEGKYTVNYNAENLPSGVYIYSLRVNDFVQNQKMALLK